MSRTGRLSFSANSRESSGAIGSLESRSVQDFWASSQQKCQAVKFAESSPLPEAKELWEDVYKTPDYPFIKD